MSRQSKSLWKKECGGNIDVEEISVEKIVTHNFSFLFLFLNPVQRLYTTFLR